MLGDFRDATSSGGPCPLHNAFIDPQKSGVPCLAAGQLGRGNTSDPYPTFDGREPLPYRCHSDTAVLPMTSRASAYATLCERL